MYYTQHFQEVYNTTLLSPPLIMQCLNVMYNGKQSNINATGVKERVQRTPNVIKTSILIQEVSLFMK